MFERFAIAEVATLSPYFNEEKIENTILGEKAIQEVIFRKGESLVICDANRANCDFVLPDQDPKKIGNIWWNINSGVLFAQVEI